MHYDPMITHSRRKLDTDLWDAWKRICCPVLTIWGESTLLNEETVQKMRSIGPKTNLLCMPGIGHCPGLTSSIEIDTIKNFSELKRLNYSVTNNLSSLHPTGCGVVVVNS